MKQKITKIFYSIFFLSFLLVNFFALGLNLNYKALAANCTVSPFWADAGKNPLPGSVTTATTGQNYYAVATFTNCQGYSPKFTIYGGSYGNFAGSTVGLGSDITQATEQRNDNVAFSQDGGYYFVALASPDTVQGIAGQQQSNTIQASANPSGNSSQPVFSVSPSQASVGDSVTVAFTNMPSGNFSALISVNGGKPSSCSSASCSIVLSQDNGAVNGANTINVSALDSQGNAIKFSSNSQTVTIGSGSGSGSKTNGATCGDSTECQSNYCAAVNSQCGPCSSASDCNSGGDSGFACTSGVCVKASAPGTGGQQSPAMGGNSATTLFNPLPEQDLTHVFLLITQGLLAILGIFAVVFIVIGGVQMVIAAGNEESLATAKKTITWAVLGLVVALLSFSIIAIVEDLLQVNIPAQPSPTSSYNAPPLDKA